MGWDFGPRVVHPASQSHGAKQKLNQMEAVVKKKAEGRETLQCFRGYERMFLKRTKLN